MTIWRSVCEISDIEKYANSLLTLCEGLLKKEKSPKKVDEIKSFQASAYNNLGFMYNIQGASSKAIDYLFKSLKINKELEDYIEVADNYSNLGSSYQQQSDTESAKKFFLKSLSIYKENKELSGMATVFNNLGALCESNGDFEKSLYYHKKSIVLWEELGSHIYKAYSLNNIGVNLNHLKLYDSSLVNYFEALKIFVENDNKEDIAWTCNLIGSLYLDLNKFDSAEYYFLKGLEITNRVKIAETKRNIVKNLYVLYQHNMDYEKALKFHKQYIELDNKIKNTETQKEALRKQLNNEHEKESELKELEHNISLEKEENQRQLLYLGVAIIVLFGGFMYNRFRVTNEQKIIIEEAHEELGEKNQEILDSITYAKRIQSAILPTDNMIKEHLIDSFVLYKPKDIVAGDFYWLENRDDKVFFAAADCTGHGVPGAMVSVVCNNALNRSVREHDLTDPGEILNKTRELVVKEFEKSDEEVKDGMDIALCSLERNRLEYAGANNPLWIIRNGELIETKANKQPIGHFDNPLSYTTHSFDLQKRDRIYIFSDGYVDQFGGEKGKKFKVKAFRELLLSIQEKSMEEQKIIIDESFETWKGNLDQIDDVCVIGVEI